MATERVIPFTIQLKRLFRRDHVFEHEVTFGVARALLHAQVIIKSNRYDNPEIAERLNKGGIELADKVVDRLAMLCFEMLSNQMRHHVGESGWWVIDDFTADFRRRFDKVDAELVRRALERHLVPEVSVLNMCVIEDSDQF